MTRWSNATFLDVMPAIPRASCIPRTFTEVKRSASISYAMVTISDVGALPEQTRLLSTSHGRLGRLARLVGSAGRSSNQPL